MEADVRARRSWAARLRGWRRIGVVLSVIWFLGFGFFLWSSVLLEKSWDSCDQTFRMAWHTLDEEIAPTAQEYMPKWNALFQRKNKCYADATWLSEISRSRSTELAWVIVANLITIGLGWLIVWGCVAVVSWMRRGFATTSRDGLVFHDHEKSAIDSD
jgi:hypothetical protein